MFGLFRTLLALLVVVHHLLNIPVIGHYAVHGFFILSGYLMTYIMHHSYGYSLKGVWSFAVNRALRLYPVYWCVLLLGIGFILIWGEDQSTAYWKFIYLPETLSDWAQNVTLIYADWFPTRVTPRISPPTWALTVELSFYLLIALGISRTKVTTLIWLGLSITYMALTHALDYPYAYRYNMILAGSLPFAIGALIYHYRDYLTSFIKKQPYLNFFTLFTALIANAGLSILADQKGLAGIKEVSVYLNYLLSAAIIVYLIKGQIPGLTTKKDKMIGDYSYPIYLLHWPAGFAASMLIWNEPILNRGIEGLINAGVALAITLVLSYLMLRLVDHPVQSVRQQIKARRKTAV